MSFQEFWLRCDCHSAEHSVLFSFDPSDEDDWLYVQPHLTKIGFWRRVKYLFGHRSRYGAFTELVLSDSQVASLEEFLSRFRNRPASVDTHPKGGDAKQGSVSDG